MAVLFFDDFNALNLGQLVGQNNWVYFSGDGAQFMVVQETTVYEGAKAVGPAGDAAVNVYHTFTANADLRVRFVLRSDDVTKPYPVVCMYSGAGLKIYVGFDNSKFCYHNGVAFLPLFDIVTDTWHVIDMECRASDDKARFRIDGGSWSSWLSQYSTWTTLDSIQLRQNTRAGRATFNGFDYIRVRTLAEEPISGGIVPILRAIDVI